MKITKLEHACLDIEEGDGRLIIDPGVYSHSFKDPSSVTALVITHVHPDHFDPKKVEAIIKASPGVEIFSTGEVAEKVQNAKVTIPKRKKIYTVGSFSLEFFGEKHGTVLPTMVVQNVGVLVNQKLYYPGDSLTICDSSFQVLAIPTEAPWLKTNELPGLLERLDCQQVFPTHDGLINDSGREVYLMWLGKFAEAAGKQLSDLKSGQSIEV